jgi:hypothetical protein
MQRFAKKIKALSEQFAFAALTLRVNDLMLSARCFLCDLAPSRLR